MLFASTKLPFTGNTNGVRPFAIDQGTYSLYVCETINNNTNLACSRAGNKTNTMKNLILSAAVLLTVSFSAIASTAVPVVNEKAQQTFAATFKNVGDVTWSSTGNNYEAFFENDGIKTRVTIDAKGKLLQTIRYYKEDKLPSNVLYNVKNDYKNSEIHGVTEVSNKNGTHYRIVLKDTKTYTHINANQAGDTELVAKYTRGDK